MNFEDKELCPYCGTGGCFKVLKEFKNLKQGEVFTLPDCLDCTDSVYMVIETCYKPYDEDEGPCHAVNLKSGEVGYFADDDEVIPLNCEFTFR